MTSPDFGAELRDGRPLDQIRLVGVRARGRHGVLADERRDGQEFVVDVVLHLDTGPAAARDDLAATVDYGALAVRVADVVRGDPVDLIETLADRIARRCLAGDDRARVAAVDVVVHKPRAPIPEVFADVVVAVRRTRADLQRPGHPDGRPAADPVATPEPGFGTAGGPGTSGGVERAEPATTGAAGEVADEPVPPSSGEPGPVTVARPDPPAVEVVRGVMALDAVPHLDDGDHRPGPDGPDGPAGPLDRAPVAPVPVVLALGTNLGDRADTLRAAVEALRASAGIDVVAVSPVVETDPVGGPDQPDYLNAVVMATTTLSPRDLLERCHRIEADGGRERTVRWGPRTLDVDVIRIGDLLSSDPELTLPHPRARERAFVLWPWLAIDPQAWLPSDSGRQRVGPMLAAAPDLGGLRTRPDLVLDGTRDGVRDGVR